MIVELCSTTDVRDKNNMTPLHLACEGGSKDVVQYLVEELKMDVGEIYIVYVLLIKLIIIIYLL